ncbi:MAG: DNA translocase FtsK 4TM domain-containing protein, partial [Dongiaceae bacterium]
MAMTGDQVYGRSSLPRMSGGGWGDFVRRRLAEIAGGAFILAGLGYLLAVLTAHEGDPSFNRAIDGPTMNLMGPVGAHIGDFALQGLGLAAIIFALAPIAWGWKLMRSRRLERWWLKLMLLPFSALLTAGACAAIPSNGMWPWAAGMGGFSGRMLLIGANGKEGLKALLDSFGVPPLLDSPLLPATFILAVAAVITLFFTLGISLGGYVMFGQRVASAGHKVGQALDHGRQSLTRR